MNIIIKTAGVNAVLTASYISCIALFLSYASKIFGPDEPKNVLVPIMMLSLLVFSAALVGVLIFGKPIMWYLDGKKKEAVSLLLYTLGIFFIITLGAVCAVYFIS